MEDSLDQTTRVWSVFAHKRVFGFVVIRAGAYPFTLFGENIDAIKITVVIAKRHWLKS